MADIQTRIIGLRQKPEDEPDGIKRPTNGRVATETEEDTSMDIYICDEKQRHCKMMTVRQNKFSKTGEIYIHGIHMTNPSDFRYGDELFKVGSELLADTTKETIQNHFHFDAEPNGRLTKTLTIRRTENGKTDEIDVRVVLFIKPEQASITYAKPGRRTIDRVEKKEEVKTQINHTKDGKTAEKEDDTVLVENIKSPEYTNMAHTKPVLPGRQPRRRTIDIVEKKEVEVEKVLIKTEYQTKYLKVGADASVVGDWLDPQNKDKFWFHLEPFNVFYESPSGPLICCKIKCDKFWLKAKHTVDEGIELELTEEDTNNHSNLFIRQKHSNGRDGTWFESLSFKGEDTSASSTDSGPSLYTTYKEKELYRDRKQRLQVELYRDRKQGLQVELYRDRKQGLQVEL